MEKYGLQLLLRQSTVLRKSSPTINLLFVPSRTIKGWKWKEQPECKVELKRLSINKPVSGTIPIAHEIEQIREQKLFDFDVKSITARGFNRFQKSYDPPSNVIEKFLSVCRSVLPNGSSMTERELGNYKLDDSKLKYELLTAAFKEFNHSIPNSMLYLMETTGDALKFYNTPIETSTPFESLYKVPNLPPNIHIQKEPLRFHPDTDTKFGGVSAFPQSSTIVTDIRAKKKFQGSKAEMRGYNYIIK